MQRILFYTLPLYTAVLHSLPVYTVALHPPLPFLFTTKLYGGTASFLKRHYSVPDRTASGYPPSPVTKLRNAPLSTLCTKPHGYIHRFPFTTNPYGGTASSLKRHYIVPNHTASGGPPWSVTNHRYLAVVSTK
jgi:hypothetical protein